MLQKAALITLLYYVIRLAVNFIASYGIFQPLVLNHNHTQNWKKYERRLTYQFRTKITIEELPVTTKDGEVLRMILMRNHSSPNCILFSHGNGGSIYTRSMVENTFFMYGSLGSVAIYDYRGYGMSTGTPSEAGVFRDAYDTWRSLIDVCGFKPNKILLVGESLGSSVSSWLAHKLITANNKKQYPSGLIMISGFGSMKQLITDMHGSVLGHFFDDDFTSDKYLEKVGGEVPVMIVHSEGDDLIPYYHHKILLGSNDTAVHYRVQGTHNQIVYGFDYIDRVDELFHLKDTPVAEKTPKTVQS